MSSLNDVYPNKTNVYVGGWKSWKKPSAYVSGSWKDAKKAWVFKDGAWVLVWDAIAAGTFPNPPVATVSNEGVDSDVTVNWDAVPQATSYNVYNVDGTVITTNTAVTSFKDTNPQDGKAGYTVKANLPGDYGNTEAISNVLTLAQAPSSLTAAPTGGVNVALAWSVSDVGHHDQIQVVRGDSSLAYLARGTTSYTDTNGQEGTVESYQVRAVISGNHGPYSNSATSAIPANVPTNVTAEATSTKGELKLSWDHPAGSRTGYQVQANDSEWVNVSDTTSPSYHTFSGSSGSKSMRVRTLSAGGASAYVSASATPVWLYAPNVPRNVSATATSTVGELKLTWSAPTNDSTHDAPTSYQVQTSTNNSSWTNRGNQSSGYVYDFGSSGSGARYMRVRATNGAGSSSYVTKSATPLWDSTPPAHPTITSFKPESSYGRMTVRYTTASSDNYEVKPVFRVDGKVYGTGYAWTRVNNSTSYSYNWGTSDAFVAGKTIYVGFYTRDVYGNERAPSFSAYYTLKPNFIEFYATDSAHWQGNRFNIVSSNAGKPIQGYYSDPSKKYNGIWTYGANTIYNGLKASGSHCGTHVDVTGKKIAIFRQQSGGVSQARNVYVGVHGFTYVPPSSETHLEPVTRQQFVGTIGWTVNNPSDFDIPNSVWDHVMSGVFQGFGVRDDSSANYMILQSKASQAYSGKVAVWCLG